MNLSDLYKLFDVVNDLEKVQVHAYAPFLRLLKENQKQRQKKLCYLLVLSIRL